MTRTRGESSGSGGWWSSACTAMALHDLKFLVRERLSWRWKASGSKLGRLWCHWSERLERDGPSWPNFGHRRRFLLELCKDKEDGGKKKAICVARGGCRLIPAVYLIAALLCHVVPSPRPTPPCISTAPPSASAAPRRRWRYRSSVWSAPSRETTAGSRSWTPLWTSSLRARPRPRAGRHQRTSPSQMSRTSGPGRMEWRRKREVGVSTVIFRLVLTRIHAGATT